jgi:hypothetical protein
MASVSAAIAKPVRVNIIAGNAAIAFRWIMIFVGPFDTYKTHNGISIWFPRSKQHTPIA